MISILYFRLLLLEIIKYKNTVEIKHSNFECMYEHSFKSNTFVNLDIGIRLYHVFSSS